MKILILANHHLGLYQFRRELIEELLKTNEVILSLPDGALLEPLKEMGCQFVDTPLERRGLNPIQDGKLFLTYRRLFRQVRPDLIVTYTIKPNVYGGFAARLAGIPYAVNITGLGTAFQRGGMLREMVTGMYRLSCKGAGAVFFENAENRRMFLEARIVRACQACLLPGAGVNLEHYQVAEYPAGDETRFLFLGRVMKEKGIEELLAAMGRLIAEGYSCSLDVAGECEEDYRQILGLREDQGWLRYHGYQADVRPVIASCHCFVLPSWHEGMANTNLECAASGRPVITSDIPGCREAVDDGVSGILVPVRDREALYQAMKRMLGMSADARARMGRAGRRKMEQEFRKEAVVAETIRALGLGIREEVR